jgi:hypothetical protein
VIPKKELPLRIIAKMGAALQQLVGPDAAEAAHRSGLIVRKRKFTAGSLARTFVLGFLQNPQASDEELAQMAAQCGAAVTPQAIEQRHTPKLVQFLKDLFRMATKIVVASDKTLAPILERFPSVTVLDSSTITLPNELEEEYPGCGGSYGGGASALKLQTELDLRSGAVAHVEIEPGRSPDGATSRQNARRGKGSLRITDLGYFNVAVFGEMTKEGEYFLSHLQLGTGVLLPEGKAIELLDWLPTKRLAWCDWTILVTNVPVELMTPDKAVVLYRARWQVELLFKRWKGQDLVAVLKGSTVVRQMVRVWSRLLAALVQHWLTIASVWGDPTKSLSKVGEAIRTLAGRLAASLDQPAALGQVVADLCAVLARTCHRNQRSKPGTFELLNDVSLLDYSLT